MTETANIVWPPKCKHIHEKGPRKGLRVFGTLTLDTHDEENGEGAHVLHEQIKLCPYCMGLVTALVHKPETGIV